MPQTPTVGHGEKYINTNFTLQLVNTCNEYTYQVRFGVTTPGFW